MYTIANINLNAWHRVLDLMPNPVSFNKKLTSKERETHDEIVFLNQAFLNKIGYTIEDIPTDKAWFDKAYPDKQYREFVITEWFRLLNEAKDNNSELLGFPAKIRCKDGEDRWFQVITHIDYNISDEYHMIVFVEIQTPNQEFLHLHSVAQQLNHSKEKLKEMNTRFKRAMDATSDGLWDWNLENDKVFFSDQWKAMLGFKSDEISSSLEEWEKRVHPDDKEQVYSDIQSYIDGTKDYYLNEHRVKCKDGSYKWILDRGIIAERDALGKPIRMIGTHTDISQRVALESSLRLSEERFRDFTLSSSDWVWEIDSQGNYTFIGDEVYDLLGYTPEELLGKNPFELMPVDEAKRVKALFSDIMSEQKAFKGLENINLHKNGSKVVVKTNGVPVFNDEGDFLGYRGTDTNITKEAMLNDALVAAKERAESISRYKSEFLANMSHEIRTPMNGILGFVEQLQKNEKDPIRVEQFKLIRTAGKTLLQIINDILDFSKIESGKIELETHQTSLHEIISETTVVFSELINGKHIAFHKNIDNDIPDCFMGDGLRLKQVIFNLLSNAIKFTPEYGSVTLLMHFDPVDNHLSVQVSDTGVGIRKEKLKSILEPFSQQDTSTTRKYGGTGLGLSIASSLIVKMGGELHVQSVENEGSTFSFTIPVALCEHEIKIAEEQFHENPKLGGHVLIVEDNKTNQMLMMIILDNIGITYDLAQDGLEAVESFQQREHYDLIFMDENMPNMNGIEATRQIRQIEKDMSHRPTPIVAVTANALSEDRQRFLDEGMDDYISKPYEEKEIIDILRNYLTV